MKNNILNLKLLFIYKYRLMFQNLSSLVEILNLDLEYFKKYIFTINFQVSIIIYSIDRNSVV